MSGCLIGLDKYPGVRPVRVGDLAMNVGKVRVDGDGGGGQVGLQYGETLWGVGIRDRRGDPLCEDPVVTACPVVGLVVYPY